MELMRGGRAGPPEGRQLYAEKADRDLQIENKCLSKQTNKQRVEHDRYDSHVACGTKTKQKKNKSLTTITIIIITIIIIIIIRIKSTGLDNVFMGFVFHSF